MPESNTLFCAVSARRSRLTEAIARLATAIDYDEVTPDPIELQALAALCDDAHLTVEAARVRRWLGWLDAVPRMVA